MGMRTSPIAMDRQPTDEDGFDGDWGGFGCGISDLFQNPDLKIGLHSFRRCFCLGVSHQ